MPNLVLLAGLPGSGKSTWAKTFFDLKYAIVSSDQIRKRLAGTLQAAHATAQRPWDVFYREIEEHLTHAVDVVADATFLTRRHRTTAREVADRTGSTLHILVFTNWVAAFDRNAAREEDACVPHNVMTDMHTLYFDMLADIPNEPFASVTCIEAFNAAAPPA